MHTVTIHPIDPTDHALNGVPCDVPECSALAVFRITSSTDAVRFGCNAHHGDLAGSLVRRINA